ncbi:MAG: Rab family GTPase [Paraglaciecola sp.]|uniref:Rab family GTPase n=1 Tax=Paraglaciecola sp. TaxID=1920173 RepID=UPI003299D1B9
MIQKKICLLGAFSVGKTSLIKRFVESIFSEKYLTTIGVKINKKKLSIAEQDINLMIWDLEGEDDYTEINTNYLRGSAGYILVADGTRAKTLDSALSIHKMVQDLLGDIPAVLAINKADIEDQWLISPESIDNIDKNLTVIKTSAKSGDNVEALFTTLSQNMLGIK